jgi:glutaredoxin 3
MYTKSWCPYCDMARRLLREKGQSWTEIDVEAEPSRRVEMIERSGRSTVPQIWIGERHVGGFDDLAALENRAASSTRCSGRGEAGRSEAGAREGRDRGSGPPATRPPSTPRARSSRPWCSPASSSAGS